MIHSLEFEVERLVAIVSKPISKCCGRKRVERQIFKVYNILEKQDLSSYQEEDLDKIKVLLNDLANQFGIRRN